ncbi:MAG: hypothetical protein COU65_02555 [Candidatus Pacebacteria bacterium CG10_big_fil_rev_8_21_14_0_10_42_12]|nr:LytR C-terminal domain-containing protein [Candidatus Paceibacterota bacterium]PIR62621.1 MAG: hypothetical protein COU65_02555 [Candidatus Pacebacteria bacterium CG10_big_fil_rev_8_21_14_0_10_42_12]
MLNTEKLLYVLPDVSYIAELLPTKKPNSFSVQSFHQINGTFMNDNEFIPEHIVKLCDKLEPGESYHLILPDFLFTNTIVSVEETSDAKIKQYLKTELLPSLDLSTETHELETFVLTELKGISKVQISAIEKTLLSPIRAGSDAVSAKISAVSPLSWAIKSVISLEPSISVLQIGDTLHSALHYIGVDQTMQSTVSDVEAIAETIKTLKGAQPSIQTVYLLTNELVQTKLKELLSDTLPLQQLSSFSDDHDKLPSYVKSIIESSMRTLSIDQFPVPRFKIGIASPEERKQYQQYKEENTTKEPMPASDLPKPTAPLTTDVEEKASEPEIKEEEIKKTEEDVIEEPKKETPAEDPVTETKPSDTMDDVNISQFTHNSEKSKTTPVVISEKPMPEKTESPVIKNKTGVGPMVKMAFITVAAFAVTVAVGIGIGLLFLNFSDKNSGNVSPVVEVEQPAVAEASPTPEPSPEPSVELAVGDLKILVVNATTKAGYAGQIGTKLEAADFAKADTGNAKGDYADPGTYLLVSEDYTDNAELLAAVNDATGLEVTYLEGKDTEDPTGKYDIVLVLAK